MSGIFLDRRVLLDGIMRRTTIGGDIFLGGKLNDYDTVAYEAFGASGLEASLKEIADLSGKLVGMRPRDLTLPPDEKILLDRTLSIAAGRPSIVRAATEYQRSAHSNSNPMDSVSYALRLLGAGRDGNLDIGVHQARLPLIFKLFEESGVNLQSGVVENTILSDPCGFPHLPRSSSGNTVYRLIPFGVDHQLDSEKASPSVSDPQIGKRIFIAYSHQDRIWLDRLLEVLSPLIRNGEIEVWSDRRITPGHLWLNEIEQALEVADIGVFLVSAPFLASDFIARHEVPTILERHRQGETAITWIAVSASLYKYTPIQRFQSLNNPERPLAELSPARRQREIVNIAHKIREMLVGSTVQ
jgi:TIR domain